MPPPPPRPPSPTREQEAPAGGPPVPTPTMRIPVNTQALQKIPEAFRGTVYETASYTVEHYYNATPRDLREIETRSPENVMESSLGMTLTAALALHCSIAQSRARIDEIRGEFQTAQAPLASAQQQEQSAKVALTAAKESEKAAQFALAAAKTELEEAEAATVAERASSNSSLEGMLYHCWAFNPDGDFSFLAPEVWEPFLAKFKARLQQEPPLRLGRLPLLASKRLRG
ncbi:uncharacterized protein LOC133804833 [Humulus lupulus]|uniref:uncharacterized protein LOC133804833 n=1 Tax=Humulus lupulus TaxID=3486 RepID=UPI002B40F4BF|nr:uncharacterized protein LOC133804833 [Humulus lupulus]